MEASIYCRSVVRDIQKSQQLASKYPGRIYRFAFESFIRDPVHYARNVYKFLDETLDGGTADWAANFRMFDNPLWYDRLTVGQSRRIMDACSDLLSLIKSQIDEQHRPFMVADLSASTSKTV
jgi:hypothetical protein